MNNNIIPEVIENINCLPYNMQKQVLHYVKELKRNLEPGVPGKHLLRFAGLISKEDLKIINETIEKDCGRVDINEW